jgi:hypothetical protein
MTPIDSVCATPLTRIVLSDDAPVGGFRRIGASTARR